MLNALLVITGTLAVLGMIFAAPITSLIAPKFAEVPGKLELTTLLTQVMLPFLTTVAVAVGSVASYWARAVGAAAATQAHAIAPTNARGHVRRRPRIATTMARWSCIRGRTTQTAFH